MAESKKRPNTDRAGLIYRALRHAIIEQALAPGAKLPEDAIGERFGASRTIVRNALGQLAAEGLVELRRNRGAAVATPSLGRGARHLRRPARPRAAGDVAARRPARRASRSRQLKAHVDEEERARGNNEPLSIRLATEFHILLARDDRQPGAGALCQRGVVALRPDPRALQPAAFVRMRRQRASRRSSPRWRRATPTRAAAVMDEHLEAVASRALIMPRPAEKPRAEGHPRALCRERSRRARNGKRNRHCAKPRRRRAPLNYASMPLRVRMRSALSFQTSICTILPPRTTKRST